MGEEMAFRQLIPLHEMAELNRVVSQIYFSDWDTHHRLQTQIGGGLDTAYHLFPSYVSTGDVVSLYEYGPMHLEKWLAIYNNGNRKVYLDLLCTFCHTKGVATVA